MKNRINITLDDENIVFMKDSGLNVSATMNRIITLIRERELSLEVLLAR